MPSKRQQPFIVSRKVRWFQGLHSVAVADGSAMGIQTVTQPILAHVYSVQQGCRWVEIPTLDNEKWAGSYVHPCTWQPSDPTLRTWLRAADYPQKTKQHISNLLQESHTLEGEWGPSRPLLVMSIVGMDQLSSWEQGKGEKKWVVNMRGHQDTVLAGLCTGSVSQRFAIRYTKMCSPHFVDLSSTSSRENSFPSPSTWYSVCPSRFFHHAELARKRLPVWLGRIIIGLHRIIEVRECDSRAIHWARDDDHDHKADVQPEPPPCHSSLLDSSYIYLIPTSVFWWTHQTKAQWQWGESAVNTNMD